MARAAFLLPARERFGGQRLSVEAGRWLGRADVQLAEAGDRAQLKRHFSVMPDRWPLAALARRADGADAANACWLRADPAFVKPDINGARMLACADGMALTREDADALLPALRPLFGDAGFILDAPLPGHWYLQLPQGAQLPAFPDPSDVLGADLFEHMPEGRDAMRWRSLLSEAQVMLHHHAHNAMREQQGRLPVNSLWFWGGGVLPDAVTTPWADVHARDDVVHALGHGISQLHALPQAWPGIKGGDALFDLRDVRELAGFDRDWWCPALDGLRKDLTQLDLDFADGYLVTHMPAQRWRVWRKRASNLL